MINHVAPNHINNVVYDMTRLNRQFDVVDLMKEILSEPVSLIFIYNVKRFAFEPN
jgi:hypothetical protein